MPENNIALYAKWIPPVHKVTYYILPGMMKLINADFSDIPHADSITSGALNEREIPAGLDLMKISKVDLGMSVPPFVPFDFQHVHCQRRHSLTSCLE